MTGDASGIGTGLGAIEGLLNSSLLTWIFTGVVIYISVLWIAIILWVTKDITNRTNNIALQIASISLVIFLTPLFGLVIYLIIRPTKTLLEQYYEDFELEMMQTEEVNKDVENCPSCNAKIEQNFKFCSYCGTNITKNCLKCKKDMRTTWHACPFCGEEAPKPPEEESVLLAEEAEIKETPEEHEAKAKKKAKHDHHDHSETNPVHSERV